MRVGCWPYWPLLLCLDRRGCGSCFVSHRSNESFFHLPGRYARRSPFEPAAVCPVLVPGSTGCIFSLPLVMHHGLVASSRECQRQLYPFGMLVVYVANLLIFCPFRFVGDQTVAGVAVSISLPSGEVGLPGAAACAPSTFR